MAKNHSSLRLRRLVGTLLDQRKCVGVAKLPSPCSSEVYTCCIFDAHTIGYHLIGLAAIARHEKMLGRNKTTGHGLFVPVAKVQLCRSYFLLGSENQLPPAGRADSLSSTCLGITSREKVSSCLIARAIALPDNRRQPSPVLTSSTRTQFHICYSAIRPFICLLGCCYCVLPCYAYFVCTPWTVCHVRYFGCG